MKCHEIKQLIYLYLDGEATQKQQARLFEHLSDCAHCNNELALAKCTHDALAEHCTLVDDVPEGFRDSIMAKIDFGKQLPVAPTVKKRKVRKSYNIIKNRFGLSVVAAALGLFFTYSLAINNIAPQIADKGDATNKSQQQNLNTPNPDMQIAQQTDPNKAPNDSKKPPQQTAVDEPDTEKNADTPKKPASPKKSPLKISPNVERKIADLTINKASVDLPQPLSISKLVYGQEVETTKPDDEKPQKLITQIAPISGSLKKVSQVAGKLEIITVQNQVAKLWYVENAGPRQADSLAASGALYAKAGKLYSADALQATVSPWGKLALLTSKNGQHEITFGDKAIQVDGKVTSDLTWSPDGRQVIYYLEYPDKLGHIESFDGLDRRQLTPDMLVQDINWTFKANNMLLNVMADAPGVWELKLPEVEFNPLTNNGGGKCITINKKGDIAFTDAAGKIFVLLKDAPSDSQLIQLTTEAANVANLTWQDDKTLLYVIAKQDQTLVWKAKLP